MNLIQQFALVGALRKGFVVDTCFAGAFHQVSDLKIVFKFKRLFCHIHSDSSVDFFSDSFSSGLFSPNKKRRHY
jgi:hypothetical protein